MNQVRSHPPVLDRKAYRYCDDYIWGYGSAVVWLSHERMWINIPWWPSNTCTISLLWRSHRYTLLSSLPETIHLPPVTLKHAAIQYLLFVWPIYVFRQRDVWWSHKRIALSCAVERIYFEFGENWTCWLYKIRFFQKDREQSRYHIASCPSASVLKQVPVDVVHIRLF